MVIAVGFTLTKAANLVKVEPNHSVGIDLQTYKRAHRIGQERTVTVWLLRAVGFCGRRGRGLTSRGKGGFIRKCLGSESRCV